MDLPQRTRSCERAVMQRRLTQRAGRARRSPAAECKIGSRGGPCRLSWTSLRLPGHSANGRGTVIRILRMSVRTGVLVCALASLMAREVKAQQAELKVPAGLPDWAFNIPDKVQPTAVKVE